MALLVAICCFFEAWVTDPQKRGTYEIGKTIITLLVGLVIGGAGALIVGGGTGCDRTGQLDGRPEDRRF
jgi:hypothetical protein